MRVAEVIAALLMGVLIGVGVTMALTSSPPAEAGDWLAFAGALVGVVATILGTLWLEHHRSRATERKQRATVTTSLNEISSALQSVQQPRGNEAIATARTARLAAEDVLLKAFDKFTYARHYIPTDDIDCWQAVEALYAAIVREKDVVERETKWLREAGDNEEVFLISIERMQGVAQRLMQPLGAAIDEIKD
jgi:hypothetical protein